jgi:hypothetical protein
LEILLQILGAGPFQAIWHDGNWFYFGSNGYNLGVGFGTLDVANFADFVANPF